MAHSQGTGTANAVVITDDRGEIVSVNAAAMALVGAVSDGDLLGRSVDILLGRFQGLTDKGTAGKPSARGFNMLCEKAQPLKFVKSDDAVASVEVSVCDSVLSGKKYCVATIRDMTESLEIERKVKESLYVDRLTGFPNKEALQLRLEKLLDPGNHLAAHFLMLEIGLDQMRMINTTYGSEAGNMLIQEVGTRLSETLRPYVFFGRGSADRFQALVEINGDDTAETLFRRLSNGISDAISGPFEVNTARVAVSLTTGGIEIPRLATDSGHALRYADMALYEAKQNHRGDAYLLTGEDVARVRELSSMVHKIREALQKQQFFPVFQPKIDMETGVCTSAECLIRWRTETGKLIPPGLFIPIAESVDLIEGIGRFIFLESCAALKEWSTDPDLKHVKLAVNLSPKQLERDNFISFVERTLDTFDIPASSLEFEITETTLANNPDVTFDRVRELTTMGVSVSIDDFGTGQSSLGMLRDVGATRAKVDRAFLQGVPEDYRANRLLGNIINLMRDMNLPVTVEGIETKEVADFVKTLRCSEGQGYYFAKPMEKADFEAFVRHADHHP